MIDNIVNESDEAFQRLIPFSKRRHFFEMRIPDERRAFSAISKAVADSNSAQFFCADE